MRLLPVITLALLLSACGREAPPAIAAARVQPPPAVTVPEPVARTPRPCVVGTTFFAGTAIEDREGWYSAHLLALNEHPLCGGASKHAEIYRLIWLPSFDPTVIVKIQREGENYRLEAKSESGAGGYEPGHLARDTVVMLTASAEQRFNTLFAAADYWRLPTVPPPDGMVGLDGAQWVLEALVDGRYHVVDRWSPDKTGPDGDFRRLAEWMLAESGFVARSLMREY